MSDPAASHQPPQHRETVSGYRLGYAKKPAAEDLARIIAEFCKPPQKSSDRLQGRFETKPITLPSGNRVVVKHYARGGLMRYLSRRLHLRSWVSRAESEFRMLSALVADGVSVPEPSMWAESGQFFVNKWLVTAEIPHAQTFAQIARQDPNRAESLLPKVTAIIQVLIAKQVHHVDFHPGNVLIDADEKAYPIDFDKAALVNFSAQDLAERYRRRWNRAIAKHGLPANLTFTHLAPPTTATTTTNTLFHKGTQCLVFVSALELPTSAFFF